VLTTVGTAEKRLFLTKTYGILETDIFTSRDALFASAVMAKTGGRGVDAVINSLAGVLLQEGCGILATHGCFVEIGKRDIDQNMVLSMGAFKKTVSFTAVDLIQLSDDRGRVVQRVLAEVMSLIKSKKIGIILPIITFPISKLEQAFRTMQAGKHTGKIAVVPEAGDLVKVSDHLQQRSTIQMFLLRRIPC
jgi:NADPH:quinone reductase-like Zn-dependent oxidoreductase